MQGYRKGTLVTIGARPSVGKSLFALNLAIKCIDQGVKCAYFSTEMLATEIQTRFLSHQSGASQRAIEERDPEATEDVLTAINKFSLSHSDCHIYDRFSTFRNLSILIRREAAQ